MRNERSTRNTSSNFLRTEYCVLLRSFVCFPSSSFFFISISISFSLSRLVSSLFLGITLRRIVQSICCGHRKCVERLLENSWIGVEHAQFLCFSLSLSFFLLFRFSASLSLSRFLSLCLTNKRREKKSENIVRAS